MNSTARDLLDGVKSNDKQKVKDAFEKRMSKSVCDKLESIEATIKKSFWKLIDDSIASK
jgi:hypothetical protein